MTELLFCYHCRRHHPADEMTQVESRGVRRWRCRASLSVGRRSVAVRDAFGKAVSQMNRLSCALAARRPLPRPVLELLSDSRRTSELLA